MFPEEAMLGKLLVLDALLVLLVVVVLLLLPPPGLGIVLLLLDAVPAAALRSSGLAVVPTVLTFASKDLVTSRKFPFARLCSQRTVLLPCVSRHSATKQYTIICDPPPSLLLEPSAAAPVAVLLPGGESREDDGPVEDVGAVAPREKNGTRAPPPPISDRPEPDMDLFKNHKFFS